MFTNSAFKFTDLFISCDIYLGGVCLENNNFKIFVCDKDFLRSTLKTRKITSIVTQYEGKREREREREKERKRDREKEKKRERETERQREREAEGKREII